MALLQIWILVIIGHAFCGGAHGLPDNRFQGNVLQRLRDLLMESLGLDPPGAPDVGGGYAGYGAVPFAQRLYPFQEALGRNGLPVPAPNSNSIVLTAVDDMFYAQFPAKPYDKPHRDVPGRGGQSSSSSSPQPDSQLFQTLLQRHIQLQQQKEEQQRQHLQKQKETQQQLEQHQQRQRQLMQLLLQLFQHKQKLETELQSRGFDPQAIRAIVREELLQQRRQPDHHFTVNTIRHLVTSALPKDSVTSSPATPPGPMMHGMFPRSSSSASTSPPSSSSSVDAVTTSSLQSILGLSRSPGSSVHLFHHPNGTVSFHVSFPPAAPQAPPANHHTTAPAHSPNQDPAPSQVQNLFTADSNLTSIPTHKQPQQPQHQPQHQHQQQPQQQRQPSSGSSVVPEFSPSLISSQTALLLQALERRRRQDQQQRLQQQQLQQQQLQQQQLQQQLQQQQLQQQLQQQFLQQQHQQYQQQQEASSTSQPASPSPSQYHLPTSPPPLSSSTAATTTPESPSSGGEVVGNNEVNRPLFQIELVYPEPRDPTKQAALYLSKAL